MSKPIKKVFQDLHKYLEQNKNKKVSEVLDDMTERFFVGSTRGASVITDAKGIVVAIHDSFDLRWKAVVGQHAVAVSQRDGGKYNTISKLNMPLYNARNAAYKKACEERDAAIVANGQLAQDLADGKIDGKTYNAQKVKVEDPEAIKTRKVESTEGFATEDECRAALTKEGVLPGKA